MDRFTSGQKDLMDYCWTTFRDGTFGPTTTTVATTTTTGTTTQTTTTQVTTTTPCQDMDIEVSVTTDNYPAETDWTITDDCNGNAEVGSLSTSYETSATTYTDKFCLPGSQYTFTITDTYGDGKYPHICFSTPVKAHESNFLFSFFRYLLRFWIGFI